MEWRMTRRMLAGAVLVAALAGCANVPRQAYNAGAAGHIRTVVVTQAVDQDEYQAYVLGHPGMSFGLIGGLIAAADMQSKTNKLTAAIDPAETRIQARFAEKLKATLEAAGYQARVLALPRDAKEEQALALAAQEQNADAVVVVEVMAAYWAAGPSTDYFPRVVAKVRKHDLKAQKLLYEDTISYGYATPQAQTVHLASEPVYRFGNIDALVADPARTRQGLYAGVEAVAAQIAADLRRP